MRRSSLCSRGRQQHDEVVKLLYKKHNNAQSNQSASPNRATVVTMLLNLNDNSLFDAAVRATKLGELNRDAMITLLQRLRSLRRLDRSELLMRAYREGGRMPSAHHYSLLMTHANEAGAWELAVQQFHAACRERQVRPQTHAALLQTLRIAGKWKDALRHFDGMCEDRVPIEPHAVHALMNATRVSAPWQVSLQVFSRAVAQGASMSAVVYLMLMRCLSSSRLPTRWHYGLSILSSVSRSPQYEVTAGLYNATMELLRVSNHWRMAVELYAAMKHEGEVPPNKETFQQLMAARRSDVQHCVMALSEARRFGSPVTTDMYRWLFSALLREGTAQQMAAFIDAELQRTVAEPSNVNVETVPLMVALLDTILSHGVPAHVKLLMDKFEHLLETVLSRSTMGLGALGDPTQRWISDGARIAVVDHNALLWRQFETLENHYDHILIPLSAVRLLVSRADEISHGNVRESRYAKSVLVRLREKLFRRTGNALDAAARRKRDSRGNGESAVDEEAVSVKCVHVLPLHHELMAHQYVVPAEQTFRSESSSNLRALRRSASDAAKELLLDEQTSEGSQQSAAARAAASISIRASNVVESTSPHRGDVFVNERGLNPAASSEPSSPPVVEPAFVADAARLSSAEMTISVAVMIRSLNPDAEIHVVSRGPKVKDAVARWNSHTTTFHQMPLVVEGVDVHSDLHDKAPAPTVVAASPGKIDAATTATLALSDVRQRVVLQKHAEDDIDFME